MASGRAAELSPAEHASLRWTHNRTCDSRHIPALPVFVPMGGRSCATAHGCSFDDIPRTRDSASSRSGHGAPIFISDLHGMYRCYEYAGALRHVAGFPGLGLPRPLRPSTKHQLATSLPTGLLEADRGGTSGRVPTFPVIPFDRGGAQLCPSGIATVTPQAFAVASLPATSTDAGVSSTLECRCIPQPSPDPSGSSWWVSGGAFNAGSSRTPSCPTCRTRTI